MDEILALAAERGLKVIEDCAQAHLGAGTWPAVGLLGDAGTFSFIRPRTSAAAARAVR
jgi:dTDP-4-amino-4,6-dideoxygalactose transaminase